MTPCVKRSFESPTHAKRAHRRASWRLRPYRCEACHRWHVTNNEKRHRGERQDR